MQTHTPPESLLENSLLADFGVRSRR